MHLFFTEKSIVHANNKNYWIIKKNLEWWAFNTTWDFFVKSFSQVWRESWRSIAVDWGACPSAVLPIIIKIIIVITFTFTFPPFQALQQLDPKPPRQAQRPEKCFVLSLDSFSPENLWYRFGQVLPFMILIIFEMSQVVTHNPSGNWTWIYYDDRNYNTFLWLLFSSPWAGTFLASEGCVDWQQLGRWRWWWRWWYGSYCTGKKYNWEFN